jgi:hypothetical protein
VEQLSIGGTLSFFAARGFATRDSMLTCNTIKMGMTFMVINFLCLSPGIKNPPVQLSRGGLVDRAEVMGVFYFLIFSIILSMRYGIILKAAIPITIVRRIFILCTG